MEDPWQSIPAVWPHSNCLARGGAGSGENDPPFKNALDWLKLLGDRNPPYLTDKVIRLISTAGGMQGLQAVNTMEFVVRAFRGWVVPLVMPIAQACKAFGRNGVPHDVQLVEQLHALGREEARGSCQFALEPPTRADAAKAEVDSPR